MSHPQDPSQRVTITQVTGDLFDSEDSLVHCVSQDLNMGKGIAKEFKKRFGRVSELKEQRARVGGVAVLSVDDRFVYYLVSKTRYFHKPKYQDLESSIKAMAEHMEEHRVTRISMPYIGCGLDQLQWHRVEAILRRVLGSLQHTIQVTVHGLSAPDVGGAASAPSSSKRGPKRRTQGEQRDTENKKRDSAALSTSVSSSPESKKQRRK
eukprot:gb/GECH01006678.1/.p1 GENE.gb/GECH01006678.1/~~gb/GECH01006678.1/.p1  ORF type:complete len:208 (+),score=52.27 gb/GECH01006678.1/:1-624(+)